MTRDMRRGRAGFTLVELLVVIAIIAVLVGMLLPAVMKMMAQGPEAAAKHEINQLAAAMGAFKTEFGVKYMPSRFVLHETLSNYDTAVTPQPTGVTSADLIQSRRFLSMMFGRRLGAQINWDQSVNATGNDTYETVAANGKVLSGEQCLVFFLGGAQVTTTPYGCLGFSHSPSDPMKRGGERRGPFYDFQAKRLVPVNGFFVYIDAFQVRGNEKPYAFLADRGTNDYAGPINTPAETSHSSYVNPYYASANPKRYLNSGGFQIISAGADGVFGDSSQYNPTRGTTDRNGEDDLSNFQRNRLGVGQD